MQPLPVSISRVFHDPEQKPCPHKTMSPFSPSPGHSGNLYPAPCLCGFVLSRDFPSLQCVSLWVCWIPLCIMFPRSFTVQLCRNSVHFYGWLALHCMTRSDFVTTHLLMDSRLVPVAHCFQWLCITPQCVTHGCSGVRVSLKTRSVWCKLPNLRRAMHCCFLLLLLAEGSLVPPAAPASVTSAIDERSPGPSTTVPGQQGKQPTPARTVQLPAAWSSENADTHRRGARLPCQTSPRF